jgi:hypothetical protein
MKRANKLQHQKRRKMSNVVHFTREEWVVLLSLKQSMNWYRERLGNPMFREPFELDRDNYKGRLSGVSLVA